MLEYMDKIQKLLVSRGRKSNCLSLEQQLIIERCFKKGLTENQCVTILLEV